MSQPSEDNNVAVTRTDEGITTITICRPHRRNAVNPATAQLLYSAFLAFEADTTQKVAILTGSDGFFCAGADLKDLTATASFNNQTNTSNDPNKGDNLQPVSGRNLGPMGPSRLQVSKPVIAAISGYAVAGGLELSLLADLRIVEEDAIFGVFCRRWGVPLIDGGTVRLPAIIGLGRAMDMILTGRAVSAQEALSMGLATRVVPKGSALLEATNMAKQLLRFPQMCMNLDRDSAYYAVYNAKGFEDALRNEFERGRKVIGVESLKGAARFTSGLGRGGRMDKL
ncbi:hypothetical protein PV10_05138 [Exophiala mesophila]|uniref:Enoyl-CoA hydratase n=1 Tax=Exophiala mesophila TaxID=212818 RepID=A0A0D1WX60_EXOME|nr:uncharacterized protein PV10_05138 [Exophiala mesophila]KIV93970.1 hypothetical protein PV10_05138 [Exophiala mesophila]